MVQGSFRHLLIDALKQTGFEVSRSRPITGQDILKSASLTAKTMNIHTGYEALKYMFQIWPDLPQFLKIPGEEHLEQTAKQFLLTAIKRNQN